MKKPFYMLLIFTITMIVCGNALAVCNCKQPAYKDEIDFLTRYTACLEECFTTRFEQIKLELDQSHKKIFDLELEINRLNLKINDLKDELTSLKAKK